MLPVIDISVITPVYNTSTVFLQQYIESIFAFDQFNLEVVIVDDGSNSEDTLNWLENIAEKDMRVKFVKNMRNQGISVCRNIALELAAGEYIVILDSDDYLYPDTLWSMLQKARHEKLDIVLSGYRWVTEDNRKIKDYFWPEGSQENPFIPYVVPTTARLIRKTIIDQNNIRYPNDCFLEDACFNIGCVAVADRIGVVDAISFCNREHKLRTSHQRSVFNAMPYRNIPFAYIIRMLKNAKEHGYKCEKQRAFYGEILCLVTSICCVFTLKTDEKEREKVINTSVMIVKRFVPQQVRTSVKYLLSGKSSIIIRILQIGFVLTIFFKFERFYVQMVSVILNFSKNIKGGVILSDVLITVITPVYNTRIEYLKKYFLLCAFRLIV